MTTQADNSPDPEANVEGLLATCLEGDPETWADEVERTARQHPDLAEELTRRFASLVQTGLASDEGLGAREGQEFGDFRLLQPLGGGAMGIVYLAWWAPRSMAVALKILRPGRQFQEEARRRFEREMVLARCVQHAAICEVLATGEHDGVPYIAMHLVEGESLAEHLEQRSLPIGEDLEVLLHQMERIARALDHAHGQGLVHRDVKPQNIMIDGAGAPVLLDFGLARRTDSDSSLLTAEGVQVGTPAYMAPEAVLGDELDARSDVYSLGATIFEAVVGQRPFEAATAAGLMHRILNAPLPDPRVKNPAVSSDLALVLRTALAKTPGRRYQSAAALADDLEAMRQGMPIQAREPGPWQRFKIFCAEQPRLAAGIVALVLAAVLITGTLVEVKSQRMELESQGRISTANRRVVDVLLNPNSSGDLVLVRDILQSLEDPLEPGPVLNLLRGNLARHHRAKDVGLSGALGEKSDGGLWALEPTAGSGFLAGVGKHLLHIEEEGSPARVWDSGIPKGAQDPRAQLCWEGAGACVMWDAEPGSAFGTSLEVFENEGDERDPCFEQAHLLAALGTKRGPLWIEAGGGGSLYLGHLELGKTFTSILLAGTETSADDMIQWGGALISADGQIIFAWGRVASEPARMWAWDASDGAALGPPVTLASEYGVYAVCSPDGTLLLTASRFGLDAASSSLSLRPSKMGELWVLQNGALRLQKTLDPTTLRGQVAGAAISQQHGVAVIHEDRTLRMYWPDGKFRWEASGLIEPREPVFQGSDDRLLVRCRDASARVFDAGGREFTIPLGAATRVRLMPEDDAVLMGSSFNNLKSWDLHSAGEIHLDGVTGGVTGICATPQGGFILVTSCGRIFSHDPVRVETDEILPLNWDPGQRILDARFVGEHFETLALLCRGEESGAVARLVILQFEILQGKGQWKVESDKSLPEDWGRAAQVAFDGQGDHCWVSTASGLRTLQKSNNAWQALGPSLASGNAWAVVSSHGGSDLLASATQEGLGFWRWPPNGDRVLVPLPADLATRDMSKAILALDPRNGILAVATSPLDSTGWELWLAEALPEVNAPKPLPRESLAPVSCLAFSPDGKQLVRASTSGEISLMATDPKSLAAAGQNLLGHQATVYALAFSADGHYLASGDGKGIAFIWHMSAATLWQEANRILDSNR